MKYDNTTDVLICSLVYEPGSYILDRFLSNLKEIQTRYPSSRIILASSEENGTAKLENLLKSYELKGTAIGFEIVKPDYARDRIWNITCGRETLRQFVLANSRADYFLFLDSDMIYEPDTVNVMLRKTQNKDIIFSGYPLKQYGTGLAGAGCMLLNRKILEKISFRCYEFRNGEVIYEDNLIEMDAFLNGAKIRKGFFLNIQHYMSATEYKSIEPQKVGLLKSIINNSMLRCILIRLSILFKYNFLWNLKKIINRNS